MDRLTVEQRSTLMSKIRSKDTAPEIVVRTLLHKLGFRYRLHQKSLSGKPDLVFPKLRKVIFVHGCYWHGHSCRWGLAQSKSNIEFWTNKIKNNRIRDKRVGRKLNRAGWRYITIWECELKSGTWIAKVLKFLCEAR